MIIECIPMPKEIGEMSPIYFKVGLKGDTGKTKWNSYQWTFFSYLQHSELFLQNPTWRRKCSWLQSLLIVKEISKSLMYLEKNSSICKLL